MNNKLLKKYVIIFLFAIILICPLVLAEDSSDSPNYAIVNNITIYNLSFNYNPIWQFNKQESITVYVKSNTGYVNLDSLTVKLKDNVASVSNSVNLVTGMYIYKYKIDEQNISSVTLDIIAVKDGITMVQAIDIPIQKGNVSLTNLRNVLLNAIEYIKENAVTAFIIFVVFIAFVILGVIISDTHRRKK
jgi:hypothetical protein